MMGRLERMGNHMGENSLTWQQKVWNNTGIFLHSIRPMLLYLLLPPAISTVAMFLYGLKGHSEYFILRSGQFYRMIGLVSTFYLLNRKCRKRNSSIWEETTMYWRQTSLRKALLLAGAGAGLSLFMSAVLTLVPFPGFLMGPYHEMSSQVYGVFDTLLAAVSVLAAAPVLEEMIFRGYVLNRMLKGYDSEKTAVLLTTVLFAVCHGTPLWIIYAMFMGLLMAHVSIVEDNTVYSVALHIGYNMTTLPLWLVNRNPAVSGILFASPVLVAVYGTIGMAGAVLCLRRYPLDLRNLVNYLPLGGRKEEWE